MGIRIKDAQIVEQVTGKERIPVSDGSGLPKTVLTEQLKEYINSEEGGDKNVQADWNETNPLSDAYIKNKPVIPDEVTEQIIEEWGFTKNKGDYSRPSDGIPKIDLDNAVQASLEKADTALQSIPDEYVTMDELDKILSGSSLEFVDLGLPSGNLWATCNIGASKPEEAGLYFAWGETNGYRVSYETVGNAIINTTITDAKGNATDRKFTSKYYKWCEDEYTKLTKYNNDPYYGKVDNLIKLQKTDDAAYAENRNCRIPSVADFEELIANTKFSKVAIGNQGCGKFTASNGNYVIFPAVGRVIEGISGINIWAVYPTSELDSTRSTDCKIMYFTSSYAPRIDSGGRGVGIPVRAVTNSTWGDDGYYTRGEIDDKIKELESIKDDLLALEISEVGEVSVTYGEKSDFVGGQIRETGELLLEFNIE